MKQLVDGGCSGAKYGTTGSIAPGRSAGRRALPAARRADGHRDLAGCRHDASPRRRPIHARDAPTARSRLQRSAAAARAGAVASRSILVFVYGFILWTIYLSFTEFEDAAGLRASPASTPMRGCGRSRTGTSRCDNLAIFGSALYRHLHRPRPAAGDPARPAHPRRGRARGRSISIRWRSPSSSPARPGNGSSIPASASRRRMHDWGWTSFNFDWLIKTGHGDLHRRHRRRLAVVGLRHGDVPRRPARHRQRDHQGGADRRRLHASRIYRRIVIPHAAAGVPLGLHRARASGDQDPTTWWSR